MTREAWRALRHRLMVVYHQAGDCHVHLSINSLRIDMDRKEQNTECPPANVVAQSVSHPDPDTACHVGSSKDSSTKRFNLLAVLEAFNHNCGLP